MVLIIIYKWCFVFLLVILWISVIPAVNSSLVVCKLACLMINPVSNFHDENLKFFSHGLHASGYYNIFF